MRPASTSRRSARRSRSSRCRPRGTARSSARTTTAPSTSSPPAARCGSSIHPELETETLEARPGGRAQRVAQRRARPRPGRSRARSSIFKELLEDGTRALIVGRADEERVAELADDLIGVKLRAGEHVLDGRPHRPARRAHPAPRGRGARPRRGARHHLRRRRRPRRPDRADPRRGRAAVPARRPLPRARPAAAEGHPAVRPAGLRQDAHREGGRELARQARRREDRQREDPLVLPQHQGPGAAQQVRRRDRAPDPAHLRAGAREERGGCARHRLLRRDGLAVPHPRHRHQLRHRVARSCRSCSPRSTASRR